MCTVVAADPGRRFAFTVDAIGRTFSTWEFEITPRGDGCEVVERATDQRTAFFKLVSVVNLNFGRRRARNRWTMQRTLDAVAHTAQR